MGKIVFCEDDPAIQKLVRVALRSAGHQVLIATDGLEGFELIERERPDVIFTDISMPRINGLQLADLVRERAELASIPIILVSASAQRIHLEEGFRHGASDYLTKPFSIADLRAKVDAFLIRSGA